MTSVGNDAAQRQLLAATLSTISGFCDLIGAHAQYLDEDGQRVVIRTLERTVVLLVGEIAWSKPYQFLPLNSATHGA